MNRQIYRFCCASPPPDVAVIPLMVTEGEDAMRMKTITALVIFLSTVGMNSHGFARYRPLTFRELSRRADLVALGTVAGTTERTFSFEIDRTIRGRPGAPRAEKGERVEVKKFRNWTCAQRWKEYSTGQRAVLFMALRSGEWSVLGAGNEGEMPVQGDWVFVDVNVAQAFDSWTVYGASYSGGRFPLREVVEALETRRDRVGRSNTSKGS
jgi:hypothetical protein